MQRVREVWRSEGNEVNNGAAPIQQLRDTGDEHIGEGRLRDALEAFKKLTELNPGDVDAHLKLATVAAAVGENDLALRQYDRIIELQTDGVEAVVSKGDFLAYLGRNPEAMACYDRALKAQPTNAAVWQKKAVVLKNTGQLEEALSAYDQALQFAPEDAQALAGKGDVLSLQEKHVEAFQFYIRAEQSPGSTFGAPDWVARGDHFYGKRMINEAIVCYDRAIALKPDYLWAWRAKGLAVQAQGNLDLAVTCFNKALEFEPGNATVLLDQGGVFLGLSKYDEALTCYNKVLELDPKNYVATVNKGVAYQNLGRYEEAISWYEKGIEIDPSQSLPWENKGFCLDELGKEGEAIECYDRAIALNSGVMWSWNNKGWIYAKRNDHKEAIKLYDKGIETFPVEVLPRLNKAKSLVKLGAVDEAISSLESALPEVSNPREALILMASIFLEQKSDRQAAIGYYQRALEMNPGDLPMKAAIAEMLILSGKNEEGRKYALEAIAGPEDTDLQCVAHFLIALSLALEGGELSTELSTLQRLLGRERQKTVAQAASWNFNDLIGKVKASELSLETKFLLLTLIDVQLGNIKTSSMAFFRDAESKPGVARK